MYLSDFLFYNWDNHVFKSYVKGNNDLSSQFDNNEEIFKYMK